MLSTLQLWTTLYHKVITFKSRNATCAMEFLKHAKGLPKTFYIDFIGPIVGTHPIIVINKALMTLNLSLLSSHLSFT